MNLVFNLGAMVMLAAFTYLNYKNLSKSLLSAGKILIEKHINKKLYFSGVVVLIVMYPLSIFARGVEFNSVVISSIGVLLLVMVSFFVTYKTSSFYICENGVVLKSIFYDFSRVKRYSYIEKKNKLKISIEVQGNNGKEFQYFYTIKEEERSSVSKIFRENIGSKNKKNKKK
ncbi:DUF5673 domain-containing protein [Helicovermis profundi]|uniref:DUF5673 domain-containing protein n=1 Tax=Helicovermis profundi TaxID=3065157 RepID=A0AAU9ERT0_9FIRM|nr:hypothetical protein HLPR_15010 [Clostridia bacterium S502]